MWLSVTTEQDPDTGQQVAAVTVHEADAQIRLQNDGTEIICDSWVLRSQLLECVMQQLHSI